MLSIFQARNERLSHEAMLNQESALRGYLLSGDEGFLDPYREGMALQLKALPPEGYTGAVDPKHVVAILGKARKGLRLPLRELEYRLGYLRELEDRRDAVLKSIEEQGKLTPELRAAIEVAPTKQELEDLYLPYKPRRRTKGQIARESGIEPLADKLFADPRLNPNDEAQAFVKAGKGEGGEDFTTVPAVLDGVRDILSERWAEAPALVQSLREWLWAEGLFRSKLASGKDENHPDVSKFRDYFDYDEPISRVPSHRALAVFRGRQQEILDAKLALPVEPEPGKPSIAEGKIALFLGWSHQARPADDLLRKCVAWAWRVNGNALQKVALTVGERDPRRQPPEQEDPRDGEAVQEREQLQPVAALEIGVAFRPRRACRGDGTMDRTGRIPRAYEDGGLGGKGVRGHEHLLSASRDRT